MEHKLAAVFMADVVGYSRLLREDEATTLGLLKTHRDDFFAPRVSAHGGRIVKTIGDGVLAEFASAVDAVSCAVEIQKAIHGQRSGPKGQIEYRIGIHLGDIAIDRDDIFGDTVNITARLEAEAAASGICISDTVRDQIGGKLDIALSGGEMVNLKNINRPVRTWHWALGAAHAPKAKAAVQAERRGRPTIAILPFDNLSGDPEQAYFADGLTEDLITALTHWHLFPVIARNSCFTYKGVAINIPEAARELGASYLVEGSVRKAGGRVRVTAQLVTGADGHHVWAKRYDRSFGDIFEVQDDLTHRIAAALAPEIQRAELQRNSPGRTADLDAWDHYLRGEAALGSQTPEALEKARRHFKAALELDPSYCDAYVGLATTHHNLIRMGAATDRSATLAKGIEAAKRAVALDAHSPRAHFALSTSYILADEHDRALTEARLAVDLNPNDPTILHALGNKSDLAGDPRGVARMELAQELDPLDPMQPVKLTFLARAYVRAGDPEKAIEKSQASITLKSDYAPAHFILAIALARADRMEEAVAALRRCQALSPGLIAARSDWRPYVDDSSNAPLLAGLKRVVDAAKL